MVASTPAAARAAVTGAYQMYFSPGTTTADRMALVERAQDFESAIAGMADSPRRASTTVEVAEVTLLDADHAELRFTVYIGGNPALPNQLGHAVRLPDAWKISASTMCLLFQVSGEKNPACGTS